MPYRYKILRYDKLNDIKEAVKYLNKVVEFRMLLDTTNHNKEWLTGKLLKVDGNFKRTGPFTIDRTGDHLKNTICRYLRISERYNVRPQKFKLSKKIT